MNANEFEKKLETIGRITTSYSGRGMHGRKCLGIKFFSIGEAFSVIANMIAETEDYGDRLSLSQVIADAEWDELGRGVVLYFPTMQVEQ